MIDTGKLRLVYGGMKNGLMASTIIDCVDEIDQLREEIKEADLQHTATIVAHKHATTSLLEEIKRLRRMLDWALKPETQAKLQADFDEHDRMMKNTGNA